MHSSIARTLGLSVGLVLAIAASALAIDLTQQYRATLDFSETPQGYAWQSGPQDVWRLKEFNYALGDGFRLRLGPSQVVFGCHESNVVWASVFPDKPGEIVAASPGKGEHVTSIWLRFHPARLGELFPERIVTDQGDASLLPRARRLAAHKMRACWHAGDRPMIPWKKSIVFDLETRERARRYYFLDTDTAKIEYEDYFRTHSLPVAKLLDSEAALEAFDNVWGAFDREYAMFVIKPQVNWANLRKTYRPRAAAASTNHELASIISEMLDHLEDLHIYVTVDGEYIPGYFRDRPFNVNPKALPRLIGKISETGHNLDWGRTADGIGYINIHELSDAALPGTFDEVLAQMADTKGLILDLRYNGGGSEPLGCAVAGRLLDRPRTYSLSQFRNGPKHTDLSPKNERACGPAGPWHYTGATVVLQGRKTMSSAESFALSLAQCPQVTTLGDSTAGSSGNPRSLEAGAGIVVNLPQWIDMDPTGKPIDVVGVPPRMKIAAEPADFAGEDDPVLAAALEHLRELLQAEGPRSEDVLMRRPGVPLSSDRPKVTSVSPAADASEVDPVTEIRIRFDRPMDPNFMYLQADPDDAGSFRRFRLRRSPQYLSETREFVFPVLLRPGSQYRFGFPAFTDIPDSDSFWTQDGLTAAPYSWQFATREPAEAAEAPAPQVVSLDPPSGAETAVFTPIRVRFDRPMDPETFELVGSASGTEGQPESITGVNAYTPFPTKYDAASHCFTFQTLLTATSRIRIELRGFRGEDGGQAAPVTVEYQVGPKLYTPEQEARISEAGRSLVLHEIVEAARRTRLATKSLEETVRCIPTPSDDDRRNWDCTMSMYGCRFGFQGDRQFYADTNGFGRSPALTAYRVGSDGHECWYFYARQIPGDAIQKVQFCPYEEVQEKKVAICDPFGAKRFSSTEEAIKGLQLEYLGTVKREEKSCHRIRSWAGSILREDLAAGFWDCLIDARSLLPIVCDHYIGGGTWRYEFSYDRINEPISEELFQSPAGNAVTREPLKLEEGYRYFRYEIGDGAGGYMGA
ncbi:MAG: Ig-like domain-containing protein, partial [Planctomycetes bacterium]|nr:Ig-like domain-containing protein [Planctomycetota bacterium]